MVRDTEQLEIPPPRENPHCYGHEQAQARLLTEFAQDRLHHAYLIHGPRGIGKATFAFRIARAILAAAATPLASAAPPPSLFGDLPPPSPEPTQGEGQDAAYLPPEHPVFRRVASGAHSDLLVLSPQTDGKKASESRLITVEQARQVPEFLSLTAAEGAWRVVIIDALDQLNPNAANALLKAIEEPPPRALLLLVCHEPGRILDTIRSRCRSLPLRPPSPDAFAEILGLIAPQISPSQRQELYVLSHGAPGYAMHLAQHQAPALYREWLALLAAGDDAGAALAFAETHAGAKSAELWAALCHCWRLTIARARLVGIGGARPLLDAAEEEALRAIAALHTPPMLDRWLSDGEALLAQTDQFHLDKRQTLRMLAQPQLLHAIA